MFLFSLILFTIGAFGDEVALGGPGESGGLGERESSWLVMLEWNELSTFKESTDVSDRVSTDSNRPKL